jgi:hypothetical protein
MTQPLTDMWSLCKCSGANGKYEGHGKVIEPRFIAASAVPPNRWMELTVKSVTPFAKRRAKGAPLLPAAHPRCYEFFDTSEFN